MPYVKKTFFDGSKEIPKTAEFQKVVAKHEQSLSEVEELLLGIDKENDECIANLQLQLAQQKKSGFSMQR